MRVIEVIRRGRRGADGQSNIVGVTTVTDNRLMSNDDSGKAFRVTSASTLTIPAVVSDGWSIIVDADGGDATLTSSSNLNGAGSDIVISDGNAALIYSSGSEHYVRFYVADAITTLNATGVGFTPITGNAATTVAGAIGVLTGLWNNVTTYGKSLIAAVDAAAARTVLGLGSAATRSAEDTLTNGSNLPDGAAVVAYVTGKRFTSPSGHTITSGDLITEAHGLGVKPGIVNLILKCTTADAGYSIDDEIFVNANASDESVGRFNTVQRDATNVSIRFSAATECFLGGNKSTGARVALTNSSWELYFEVMA